MKWDVHPFPSSPALFASVVCAVVAAACSRPASTPAGAAAIAEDSAQVPPNAPAVDSSLATQASANAAGARSSAGTIPAQFERDLRAIALSYPSMSRADGTWWSPLDCRAPVHPSFLSQAESGPHGKKIFTLFVKDIASYAALTGRKVDVQRSVDLKGVSGLAQIVVKEAWRPVERDRFDELCKKSDAEPTLSSSLAPVTMNGKTFVACEPAGLFIMYRPVEPMEGSDDGWVYGTVQWERDDAASRPGLTSFVPRVTSAGRIENCMGCHTKAPHGRLFGLPY
jgi:hypothetical protein